MLPLLLLATMANAVAAPSPGEVSLRPVEQRLELELDPGALTWSGSLLASVQVDGTGRRFALRLSGPAVSRVEMTDERGHVELAWGLDERGRLLVEAARPFAPGPASLNVAFHGEWRTSGPGVARDSARTLAWLERGAGAAFPDWPQPSATRWQLLVHAPRGFEVRASGRRTGIDGARGWRTWNFRTARAAPGDSLRVTVRRAAGPARR